MKQSPEIAAAMRLLLGKRLLRRFERHVSQDASGVGLLRRFLDHVLDLEDQVWERFLRDLARLPSVDAAAVEATAARELADIVRQHGEHDNLR